MVTFRYERYLNHPIDAIWKALTDAAESRAWFGDRLEIEPHAGGEFVSHHQGGIRVVDRVVRFEPPTLLEHTFWQELNPSALVTWELHPHEGGCVFSLTHRLSMEDVQSVATSQSADPMFILARNAAGWHRLLDKLEAWLDGEMPAWSEGKQRELQERYAEMLV